MVPGSHVDKIREWGVGRIGCDALWVRGFGIDDWCHLADWEYASMANGCSKSVVSANCVLPMIRKVREGGKLPVALHEVIYYYGFAMKSAALILHAVYGREFGIACDVHLNRIFQSFGWIRETTDPTRIACTVMTWLESEYWSEVNNVFAGMAQLVSARGKGKGYLYRDNILKCAKDLDEELPVRCENDLTAVHMVKKLIDVAKRKR